MPTFKVKELMIQALPTDAQEFEACGETTLRGCAQITRCGDVTFAGCNVSICRVTAFKACDADGGCSCTFDSTACRSVSCKSPALQLEHLATLKAELRRTMARLDAEERILEDELRPRTPDDVNQLERALTDALEELQGQRSGLGESGEAHEEAPRGPE